AGTVWRCDPDGGHLERVGHNFRRPPGCAVTTAGEIWLAEAGDDGTRDARAVVVLPGGNHGYLPTGPGEPAWHDGRPGVVPTAVGLGFGVPTGIAVYEGRLLPSGWFGRFLVSDSGTAQVRALVPASRGAGFGGRVEPFLDGIPGEFAPAGVAVAPDGSVFVADAGGRILRVTPDGHTGYAPPDVSAAGRDQFQAALLSPCPAARGVAIAAANARESVAELAILAARVQPTDEFLKLRATAISGGSPQELLSLTGVIESAAVLTRTPTNVRSATFRRLAGLVSDGARASVSIPYAIRRELANQPANVRAALASLLPPMHEPDAVAMFYLLARRHYAGDDFHRAALGVAAGCTPERRKAIVDRFDTFFPTWTPAAADLAAELLPPSVVERAAKSFTDPAVVTDAKVRAIDALAAVGDRPAAAA
ncbi:MAG: hypothetical protein ACRC7O_13715, partial [Fimbriiglobus sp.]